VQKAHKKETSVARTGTNTSANSTLSNDRSDAFNDTLAKQFANIQKLMSECNENQRAVNYKKITEIQGNIEQKLNDNRETLTAEQYKIHFLCWSNSKITVQIWFDNDQHKIDTYYQSVEQLMGSVPTNIDNAHILSNVIHIQFVCIKSAVKRLKSVPVNEAKTNELGQVVNKLAQCWFSYPEHQQGLFKGKSEALSVFIRTGIAILDEMRNVVVQQFPFGGVENKLAQYNLLLSRIVINIWQHIEVLHLRPGAVAVSQLSHLYNYLVQSELPNLQANISAQRMLQHAEKSRKYVLDKGQLEKAIINLRASQVLEVLYNQREVFAAQLRAIELTTTPAYVAPDVDQNTQLDRAVEIFGYFYYMILLSKYYFDRKDYDTAEKNFKEVSHYFEKKIDDYNIYFKAFALFHAEIIVKYNILACFFYATNIDIVNSVDLLSKCSDLFVTRFPEPASPLWRRLVAALKSSEQAGGSLSITITPDKDTPLVADAYSALIDYFPRMPVDTTPSQVTNLDVKAVLNQVLIAYYIRRTNFYSRLCQKLQTEARKALKSEAIQMQQALERACTDPDMAELIKFQRVESRLTRVRFVLDHLDVPIVKLVDFERLLIAAHVKLTEVFAKENKEIFVCIAIELAEFIERCETIAASRRHAEMVKILKQVEEVLQPPCAFDPLKTYQKRLRFLYVRITHDLAEDYPAACSYADQALANIPVWEKITDVEDRPYVVNIAATKISSIITLHRALTQTSNQPKATDDNIKLSFIRLLLAINTSWFAVNEKTVLVTRLGDLLKAPRFNEAAGYLITVFHDAALLFLEAAKTSPNIAVLKQQTYFNNFTNHMGMVCECICTTYRNTPILLGQLGPEVVMQLSQLPLLYALLVNQSHLIRDFFSTIFIRYADSAEFAAATPTYKNDYTNVLAQNTLYGRLQALESTGFFKQINELPVRLMNQSNNVNEKGATIYRLCDEHRQQGKTQFEQDYLQFSAIIHYLIELWQARDYSQLSALYTIQARFLNGFAEQQKENLDLSYLINPPLFYHFLLISAHQYLVNNRYTEAKACLKTLSLYVEQCKSKFGLVMLHPVLTQARDYTSCQDAMEHYLQLHNDAKRLYLGSSNSDVISSFSYFVAATTFTLMSRMKEDIKNTDLVRVLLLDYTPFIILNIQLFKNSAKQFCVLRPARQKYREVAKHLDTIIEGLTQYKERVTGAEEKEVIVATLVQLAEVKKLITKTPVSAPTIAATVASASGAHAESEKKAVIDPVVIQAAEAIPVPNAVTVHHTAQVDEDSVNVDTAAQPTATANDSNLTQSVAAVAALDTAVAAPIIELLRAPQPQTVIPVLPPYRDSRKNLDRDAKDKEVATHSRSESFTTAVNGHLTSSAAFFKKTQPPKDAGQDTADIVAKSTHAGQDQTGHAGLPAQPNSSKTLTASRPVHSVQQRRTPHGGRTEHRVSAKLNSSNHADSKRAKPVPLPNLASTKDFPVLPVAPKVQPAPAVVAANHRSANGIAVASKVVAVENGKSTNHLVSAQAIVTGVADQSAASTVSVKQNIVADAVPTAVQIPAATTAVQLPATPTPHANGQTQADYWKQQVVELQAENENLRADKVAMTKILQRFEEGFKEKDEALRKKDAELEILRREAAVLIQFRAATLYAQQQAMPANGYADAAPGFPKTNGYY